MTRIVVDPSPYEVEVPVADTGEIPNPHAVFLRTDYNYNRDDASRRSALVCLDPSRARQDMKDECDINTIVANFGVTGTLPRSVVLPFNGEFAETHDYQSALNQIMEADRAFMEFPANVRERFHNSAAKMIEWAQDPANVGEAQKLGLTRPGWKSPEEMAAVAAKPSEST